MFPDKFNSDTYQDSQFGKDLWNSVQKKVKTRGVEEGWGNILRKDGSKKGHGKGKLYKNLMLRDPIPDRDGM
jgi:hypothetical protein